MSAEQVDKTWRGGPGLTVRVSGTTTGNGGRSAEGCCCSNTPPKVMSSITTTAPTTARPASVRRLRGQAMQADTRNLIQNIVVLALAVGASVYSDNYWWLLLLALWSSES